MIRVLLAEDHAVVRAGLEELLEGSDEIEVVGSAADGRSAVALAAELQPTVALCDLSMPGLDGIEATSRILEQSPETRVVILTAFSDPDRIRGALDAGAVGYLLKDADPEELFGAVRAAARGESPLAPKAASVLLADRAGRRSVELTPRERDVLSLLASGLPNKRIASRLEISEKTVKAHLTRVFERIGVTDRTQAALWAQRNGTPPSPMARSQAAPIRCDSGRRPGRDRDDGGGPGDFRCGDGPRHWRAPDAAREDRRRRDLPEPRLRHPGQVRRQRPAVQLFSRLA